MITRGNEQSGATFSECGLYRYELWRRWPNGLYSPDTRLMVVIGLNPSTADESNLDPTLRRCVSFAEREGLAGLVMLNLFALRSTDPKGLCRVDDPIGPENDAVLLKWFELYPSTTVAAWGNFKLAAGRAADVLRLRDPIAQSMKCLGMNQDGSPKHPLYLASDTKLVPLLRVVEA